jgi:hypothetical protein
VGSLSLPRSVWLGGALILGVSCQVLEGIDEYDTAPPEESTTTQSSGSGGASTASAGGDGGSGAGSGGAGAGPPPPECNDGDGVCLAEIPSGWTGYYFLHSTALGQGSAECPDGSTTLRSFSDPSTAPAECSQCQCSAPTLACAAQLQASQYGDCTTQAQILELNNEQCQMTGNLVNFVFTGEATVTSVACTASGGAAEPLDDTFLAEHNLCEASALGPGGCGSGEVCVDKGAVPSICIRKMGPSAGCPDGWEEATRLETYSSGVDERACSPCACEDPAGNPCSGGDYLFFNDGSCNGPPDYTLPEGSRCSPVADSLSARYEPPGDSECVSVGGAPVGNIELGPIVTLCCR